MNSYPTDKSFMAAALWKQHFTQLKDSNKSLTQLLISGELVLADYIKWAAENYKLPFLNDSFFTQTKNHKLVLENPHAQWSEFFFPIHEWQGTIYIGCVEPQDFSFTKKHCFVLCSPTQLSSLWGTMQKPANASLPKPPAETFSELNKLQFEEVKLEVSKQVNYDTQATQTNINTVSLITPSANEKTATSTSQLKTQDVKINPNFSVTNYDVPEITNVVRAPNSKGSDTNFTNTKTIMPFPERSTQFTFIRTVYSDQVIIDAKAKIQENTDPQDALISAFKILKDYYKKLMWVVRDHKGYAFPIACNTEWEFTEEAWNTPMDFKTANPFRIAKLTQKPYHGAIANNTASDHFFKQWANGTYPDVMSIVPVKINGKVFGYFIGCEKGSHFQDNHSLELIESVCTELVATFIRIHKELAKAS